MDIATWLEALGLGEYVEAFSRNHVTPDILTSLTDPDLKDIGVASLGHRRTLLAAIAALASGAAALKRVPPKEQRHVAILFADLTDFTGLAQRLGAERLHDLATRYAAISEEAVARYGGTVDKHIGDAAMALFGTPVAHGDDALRAVRCALAIHAAMPALGGEFGLSLSAHIGIAVGDVVAGAVRGDGRSGYTVLGDAVNLAARLAGLAGPGETLVANDLRRAVEPAIAFSKIGPRAIKGYAAEIPVFRVEGFSSDGASGPFVGRQAELAQLDALLDLCGQGRGHVAVLRGEPGIGKSRLLAEAGARAASRGFKLIRGQALDFGEIDKRDPLAQIVGDMIRVAGQRPNSNPDGDRDGDPARSLAKNLAGNLAALVQSNAIDRATADLLADVAGGDRTQAVIDWLRAMDAATRDRKRQAAIAALAEAAARQGPLFVMVEDVHWAERSQVDQLAALAAAMTDWPILFAITTRLDVDPLDAAWRAQVGATPITVLDLRTLRTDDCLALARQALGDNELLARMCVDRAEGNPLFLDQILRYARDALSDTVPASIKSLVLSRLDQISSVDRNQVQAASVLGQRPGCPGACRRQRPCPPPGWTS
ncbi:MAG: adenylate/guanylate cyclase domain-containing protein [Alphaproteobacteria bacterium]